MMDSRYAIYLAPPEDTPLWDFGSRVLGYDAASGLDRPGFAPDGIEPAIWRRITMRPRNYGFHATLKAPFRLAEGRSLTDLEQELVRYAASRDAFDLGPLAVTSLADEAGHGFVALTQTQPSPDLVSLEAEVVAGFDHFRAPMSDTERAKRKPQHLSARQREALDRFGYPHVGPDYRFHMTLSGEVADVHEIADKLADAIANEIGTAHLAVDALVLFGQPSTGEPFRIIRRAALNSRLDLR
jgi:2'-5' RNA ligase